MVLRVFKSFKRSLYPFFLRLIRESASVDIIFHKWIVDPLILVYQKTITNPKTPNLRPTILQRWLIPTAEVWQSSCMTHRFITKQSFIGKRWGRIISLQNTHPIHTPLSFLKPFRNAWNLLPTSSCCRQKENHQLKCALCGSCQCGGVGEAKEETHGHQSGGGVTANILYLLGDTWRNPTLHWTLGGTPHCTEHLEITITSLLSLLPSALTEGRVLEHSCQWDLGRNSQICDFLFLWLHCWLFKGNIHF